MAFVSCRRREGAEDSLQIGDYFGIVQSEGKEKKTLLLKALSFEHNKGELLEQSMSEIKYLLKAYTFQACRDY